MKITDRGVHHNDTGANHNARLLWYAPGGVNHNDKTVMINPPGAYHNGGVNENLTPAPNVPQKRDHIIINSKL